MGTSCGRLRYWSTGHLQRAFPARWDKLEAEVGSLDFTEHEAGQLLTVFASHWDHLPMAASRDDIRYHLVVLALAARREQVAVAIYARALRPDRIVVAYPMVVRRLRQGAPRQHRGNIVPVGARQ